jgi:hypothetical protein
MTRITIVLAAIAVGSAVLATSQASAQSPDQPCLHLDSREG